MDKVPGATVFQVPCSWGANVLRYARYYVDEVPGLAIFVRDLPLDITPDKLGGAFAAFGPVRHVNLKTQKGKDSFAFVTFEATEAASAAIERPPVIGGVQARAVLSSSPMLSPFE